eukprot:CAMPEP_0171573322 /NCGR_PEP_ID=MMETSP0961-20121227/4685_1 /TAXON_ID=87120 /ORGANISM="Aurantiochytrium limacinum, Strain ATCCMYA-1381" /LENGTH=105 /DNA_ID=CAMNT_0012128409 /DNA_START=370 /DNA_END=684 /DNA_ORIENTATION=-
MDTFTQTFLQDRGLESFEQRLVNLGVSSVEDLSALTEQDFEKIGMLVVHIRKVQQGLAELRSPGGGSVGEYGSPASRVSLELENPWKHGRAQAQTVMKPRRKTKK